MPLGLRAFVRFIGTHKTCEGGLFGSRCGGCKVVIECILYRDGLAPKCNDGRGAERLSCRRLTLLALGKSADNPGAVALHKRFDTLAAGADRCAGVDLAARCDA